MGPRRAAALPAGFAACLCFNSVLAQDAPALRRDTDEPLPVQQLYRDALKARDAGNVHDAVDGLRRAAELAPDDTDIQVHLGLALAAKRSFGPAKAALQKALDRAPDYADARLGLARIAFWSEDLDGAERELRLLLARAPDNSEARALEKQVSEARKAARAKSSVVGKADNDKQATARRLAVAQAKGRRLAEARAWRLRGSFSDAEQLFRKTLADDGRNAEIWCELGLTLAYAKRYGEARDAYSKALSIDPASAEARLGLARVDFYAGELASAESRLADILASRPDDIEAGSLRARVRLARGDARSAEAEFREIAARDPKNADAFAGWGDSLRGLLRDDEAHEVYGRAALLAPDSDEVQTRLAAPSRPRWRLDVDGSLSHLSGNLAPWRGFAGRLGYQLDERATVSGGVATERRFGRRETMSDARLDYRWSDLGSVNIGLGGTPGGQFLPVLQADAGGSLRVRPGSGPFGPTFTTLDVRFAHYSAGNVSTFSPGVQQYTLNGRLWFTAKAIAALNERGEWLGGFTTRADLAVTDRLQIFVGYADAPDSSDGQTVQTRSFFGGASFDLDERTSMRVSAARESRQRSYDRSIINLGFSTRL